MPEAANPAQPKQSGVPTATAFGESETLPSIAELSGGCPFTDNVSNTVFPGYKLSNLYILFLATLIQFLYTSRTMFILNS